MAEEACPFDGIDDARGARDIVNLMGTVDVCWWWGVVLKHSVGIEEVVLVKKGCPLTGRVVLFVCVNHEDNLLILGEERFDVCTEVGQDLRTWARLTLVIAQVAKLLKVRGIA